MMKMAKLLAALRAATDEERREFRDLLRMAHHRPDVTYGNPDLNCNLCLGHGVRPVDGMVVWCECQTEPVNGPLCTDADGKPVSLRKTDCFGGCGRYAYLVPLEGMRFTCSTCQPPQMCVYGEPLLSLDLPAIVPAP